jgi:hypothetical protein
MSSYVNISSKLVLITKARDVLNLKIMLLGIGSAQKTKNE